jgi:hypothetical protein
MARLHRVLDEVFAETQSSGFELSVEGRIRLLGFRRITAENRLVEAIGHIDDAIETLRSRHIDNGTLERLEAFKARLAASAAPVRTQPTVERGLEEVMPDPA